MPIKELVRRTGLARNTIRVALRSEEPPTLRLPVRPSKLDPFKDEIHRLLKDDPKLPGVRVREDIEPLGFDGGKSIIDDYLREIRPMFKRARTHQRTVYRPGEICQWDLWETSRSTALRGQFSIGLDTRTTMAIPVCGRPVTQHPCRLSMATENSRSAATLAPHWWRRRSPETAPRPHRLTRAGAPRGR